MVKSFAYLGLAIAVMSEVVTSRTIDTQGKGVLIVQNIDTGIPRQEVEALLQNDTLLQDKKFCIGIHAPTGCVGFCPKCRNHEVAHDDLSLFRIDDDYNLRYDIPNSESIKESFNVAKLDYNRFNSQTTNSSDITDILNLSGCYGYYDPETDICHGFDPRLN